MPNRHSSGTRLCIYHRKKHFATQWHCSGGEFPCFFCHASYMASRHNDHNSIGLWHPTWEAFKEALNEHDATGWPITRVHSRPDIAGLRSIYSLGQASPRWQQLGDIVFLLMLMLQLYWSWPMVSLWTSLHDLHPNQLTAPVLKARIRTVVRMFKGLKVVDGQLCASGRGGLSPFRNPSERRSGLLRLNRMCHGLPDLRCCAQSLADYLASVNSVQLRPCLRIF